MLISISTSSPPFNVSQEKAADELKKRMGAERPAIARMIDAASAHSGIDQRSFVVPDGEDSADNKFYSLNGSYIRPETEIRMLEYEKWSKQLTVNAAEKALNESKINPEKINRLITISCTGFFAPGLDYHLIQSLNISPSVKRTNIGFMGCAAALIGFNSVLEALNSGEENILMVAVELCSLHLQTEPTRDNILANMIFADGCAAAVFSSDKQNAKLQLVKTASYLFNDSAGFMGWKIGNFGFEMILSSELPKIILNQAVPTLLNILKDNGLSRDDISYWALHPGGRAILDSLQNGLALSDEEMESSRKVLQNYGNMSSASILFVMKEILSAKQIEKGKYLCCVAFGPGLTMEVALFKGV